MDIAHRYIMLFIYIYIYTVNNHTPDGYFVPKKKERLDLPNSMDFSAWLIIKKQLFQLKNESAKKKYSMDILKKALI